ncbi:hypothetical protein V1264_007861 [Littorina saxatilis]|uniref:Uncharacterized protein n=1 Tax=Littorina saxatilis TaxID=31220 RepID=A0AAN9AVT0_9CAEN
MDGARRLDHGWTEAMKASVIKNRTKLIDTLAGSVARIMDLLVEGGVFSDTDNIMNNTTLDTPKKRARRLLDDIPKRPARDYWTLVLSLYDDQAALGHMAEVVLSTYVEKGGALSNADVRRARRDYQENQTVDRPLFSSPQTPTIQRQQQHQPTSAQPHLQSSHPQHGGQAVLPLPTPVQEVQMPPATQRQMEFEIPVGTALPEVQHLSIQPTPHHGCRLSEGNQLLTVDSESQPAGGARSHEPMETDAERPISLHHGGARPKVRTPANSGDATARPAMTKYQKKRHKYPDRVYQMDSNPRGIAFIIDNEEFLWLKNRDGTQDDCRALEHLLQNILHFQVCPVKKNLTGQQMKQKLLKFSQDKRLGKVDSCVVIILSHGSDGDIIFGKDGQLDGNSKPVENTYIRVTDLRTLFCTSGCAALSGKPKLFIFQACRGANEDTSLGHLPVTSRARCDVALETHQQRNQSDFSDMYFLYATVADFVAYRGTFIPKLVEVFQQHAGDMHVKDMVTELHRRMSQKPLFVEQGDVKIFSTPEERGHLSKQWFLNPPQRPAS